MRPFVHVAAFTLAIAALPATGFAQGCVKGAVVGGVAGKVVGDHPVIGAAAGCAIEHRREQKEDHRAADADRDARDARDARLREDARMRADERARR